MPKTLDREQTSLNTDPIRRRWFFFFRNECNRILTAQVANVSAQWLALATQSKNVLGATLQRIQDGIGLVLCISRYAKFRYQNQDLDGKKSQHDARINSGVFPFIMTVGHRARTLFYSTWAEWMLSEFHRGWGSGSSHTHIHTRARWR